jgi:hypothetical protein
MAITGFANISRKIGKPPAIDAYVKVDRPGIDLGQGFALQIVET